MRGVEEAIQVSATPTRKEVELRVGGGEESPQSIEPDDADVSGLYYRDERL